MLFFGTLPADIVEEFLTDIDIYYAFVRLLNPECAAWVEPGRVYEIGDVD